MATRFQPGVTALDELYLMGTKLSRNVREAVTKATLDGTTDEVTQLEIELLDSNFAILKTGVITPGMRMDFLGYSFEVAVITTGGSDNLETVNVKARPLIHRRLDELRGTKVMKNASPSDFVVAECKAVGASYVVQPSAKRNQVARDVPQGNTEGQRPPSSWTTFKRLAGELGFLCFESQNKIYFGKPSWLIKNVAAGAALAVGYKTGAEANRTANTPQCKYSVDDPKGTTFSAQVDIARANDLLLGRQVQLSGVPTFDGQYMLGGINYNLLSPSATAEIDCRKPTDPPVRGGDGTRKKTKSADDFVYWAMQQIGDKYIFGVEVKPTTSNPTAFDCSELVEWACAQVDVYIPDYSEAQINYCTSRGGQISVSQGIATKGALLWHPGHIAISLGNGKTVEAANSRVGVISGNASGRFTKAAKIPGMKYNNQ